MTGRLHHLDALRSFCMLFGILVHTGTLAPGLAVSQAVFDISENFRMATFFVISGFFGVLLLDRRGARSFLGHRAQGLAIPFLAGVMLLNPVTLWLIYVETTGRRGS